MSGIIYPINNKTYTAEDVEIFNCTRTNGVYSVLDFDCVLNGNTATIGKGLAWIKNGDFKGKSIAFKENTTLVFDSADSSLDRYDVIGLRYDATKTEPELVVKTGVASNNPTLPEMSRESYLYELFLYSVLRKAGESTISEDNLTDLRENEAYCGIMQDSVTSAVAPLYEEVYNSGNLSIGLEEGDTFQANGLENYEHLNVRIRAGLIVANIQTVKTESASGISGRISYYGTVASRENIYTINLEIENLGSGQYSVNILKWKTESTDLVTTNCWIVSIEGVSKTPRGYVAVDSMYNPNSDNAQSGKAVDEAVRNFFEGDYTPSDKIIAEPDIEKQYEEKEIYNANAVNALMHMFAEVVLGELYSYESAINSLTNRIEVLEEEAEIINEISELVGGEVLTVIDEGGDE